MPDTSTNSAVSQFALNRLISSAVPGVGLFTTGIGIASAIRGRGSPAVKIPGVGFKGKKTPFLESLFLDIPEQTVQGRRKQQPVFEERQKVIDFGISETQKRLKLLGADDELDFFNKGIKDFKAAKHTSGTPVGLRLQQSQLDLIESTEGFVISKRKELGFTSVQSKEFDRQSQERAFDFNKKEFLPLIKSQLPRESAFPLADDGVSFGNTKPTGVDGSRLKLFAKSFRKTDISAFRNEDVLGRFGNARNAENVFFTGQFETGVHGKKEDIEFLNSKIFPRLANPFKTPITGGDLSKINTANAQAAPANRRRKAITRARNVFTTPLGLASGGLG